MKRLLRIDTSTRGKESHSKNLASEYERYWQKKYPDSTIILRDLSSSNIPHLSQSFIEAMFMPEENRTSTHHESLILSNILIDELKSADTLLLSVPMYNFSIPSSLKAYIDHISRIGETFSMDESGFIGLITGKKLIIAAAYGAEFSDMKAMDFVEPYLKSLFGFLGFTDIEYYAIEGTSMLSAEELNIKIDRKTHV